jgi:A/G-specific adenine glycosylase
MNVSNQKFKKIILDYYAEHARHDLPWRKNQTPYRVLVSEIMLQQTQALRVVSFYQNWMKQFPTWKKLAQAKTSNVLIAWKGLGYNSRALRLQKLAQVVQTEYRGILPRSYKDLLNLPGIGPYTAGAIRAFAWDLWTPVIETNIRRVYIHHFFNDTETVSDSEIMKKIEELGVPESPRIWYEAIMDYGSILPKTTRYNANTKSKHYTKQSKFEGSRRQIRGKILEILLENSSKKIKKDFLHKKLKEKYGISVEIAELQEILNALEKESFIKQTSQTLYLTSS